MVDRCIATAICTATAKCTQLACVKFNYDSSTFNETVIEPGALTLFKTTGALQFTLCKNSISADFHQQKNPSGGITEIGHARGRLGCSSHG